MLWAHVPPGEESSVMDVPSWKVCRNKWSLLLIIDQWILNPDIIVPCSNTFTWVVGFSAKVLSPIKVTSELALFIELAFLGNVQDVEDAVHRSFDREDLLNHTPIILLHAPKGSGDDVSVTQFMVSNPDCPWGLDVPNCPNCGTNIFLKTQMLDMSKSCRISCGYCHFQVEVDQPHFIQGCNKNHLRPHRYFTSPFPVPPQPWPNALWKFGNLATSWMSLSPSRTPSRHEWYGDGGWRWWRVMMMMMKEGRQWWWWWTCTCTFYCIPSLIQALWGFCDTHCETWSEKLDLGCQMFDVWTLGFISHDTAVAHMDEIALYYNLVC